MMLLNLRLLFQDQVRWERFLPLDGIYKERGKELWLEGWRRNDMVRFGTFLAERQLKPYVSANKYALYPYTI
jgi:hypothetical protein